MTRNRFNHALAWLCLIWFGLTNTLFAGGMVVCRDGHGGARVEWGCSRNASGECVASCGIGVGESEGEGDQPHPCDDTPIKGDHQVAKAPPRTTAYAPVLIPVVPAVVAMHFDLPHPARVTWDRARPQRPPDTLQRLRTVILLV